MTDRLQKSQEAHNLLSKCGTALPKTPATEEIISELELIFIKYIYADAKHKTLAESRAAKWQAMKRKQIIRLIPDSDSLRHHMERANYLHTFKSTINFRLIHRLLFMGGILLMGYACQSVILSHLFRHQ